MAKAKTIAPAPLAAQFAPGWLAGKIALATSAAGNLGGYIVRHYLAEGATVVVTRRTEAQLPKRCVRQAVSMRR